MRKLAAEESMSPKLMRLMVHNDLKMSSCCLEQSHFIGDGQKQKRLVRAKKLIQMIRDGTQFGEILFNNEKLLTIEAKFNCRNDRVLAKN